MTACNVARAVRRSDRLANAHETVSAGLACTRDYRLAIMIERGVGQVCVAVQERHHDAKPPPFKGRRLRDASRDSGFAGRFAALLLLRGRWRITHRARPNAAAFAHGARPLALDP